MNILKVALSVGLCKSATVVDLEDVGEKHEVFSCDALVPPGRKSYHASMTIADGIVSPSYIPFGHCRPAIMANATGNREACH